MRQGAPPFRGTLPPFLPALPPLRRTPPLCGMGAPPFPPATPPFAAGALPFQMGAASEPGTPAFHTGKPPPETGRQAWSGKREASQSSGGMAAKRAQVPHRALVRYSGRFWAILHSADKSLQRHLHPLGQLRQHRHPRLPLPLQCPQPHPGGTAAISIPERSQPHPGGITAISRWLSEATPPECRRTIVHPGGVAASHGTDLSVTISCDPSGVRRRVRTRSGGVARQTRSTTG